MSQTNESLINGILKFMYEKEAQDWECLYGPKHVAPFVNGRCAKCGEDPKGD